MFGTILISVVSLMHIYVFWRIITVPFVKRTFPKKYILGIGIFFWAIFFIGWGCAHSRTGSLAIVLEFVGMNWMGALFLMFSMILLVDVISAGGFIMPRLAPSLRGLAVGVGMIFAAIALAQGLRAPLIQAYDIDVAGLPAEMNGTVMVAMSDLHLGSLLGKQWLARRIDQVVAQKADIIVLLGDQFDNGHRAPPQDLLPELKRLTAPFGVWAVNGNHESYGHNENSGQLKAAGIQLLRNRWVEITPGLVLAGVDDLTVARRRSGSPKDLVKMALQDKPKASTILLSHTPWQAEDAAQGGVDLLLSGHTHGGQIWPFGFLVKRVYPLLAGRYKIDNMDVIVCRGTGTWGPRMRLWSPGEILRITLHAKD